MWALPAFRIDYPRLSLRSDLLFRTGRTRARSPQINYIIDIVFSSLNERYFIYQILAIRKSSSITDAVYLYDFEDIPRTV
jgi:hypothetical protein